MNIQKHRPEILVITPDLPYPLTYGARVRIYALIKALKKRFSVTVFSYLRGGETPGDIDTVEKICDRLIVHLMPNQKGVISKFYHRLRFETEHLLTGKPAHVYYNNLAPLQRAIENLLAKETFDAVLQEYWYTTVHLHQHTKKVLAIIDTHDVHFERMKLFPPDGFFRFPKRDLEKYKSMELKTLQSYDLVIALSEGEKENFSRYLNNEIEVVPTGVDMKDFSSYPTVEAMPDRIGFFGTMANPTNQDAILHFCQEVFPGILKYKPEAELYIIGSLVPPDIRALEKHPRIRVTGFVPDLTKELQKLQLAVMPIRVASGSRGRI